MLAIFPLAFVFMVLTGPAQATTNHVLDVDGNPVKAGIPYYILPARSSQFGGLTSVSRNGSCPFNVVQADSRFDEGTLVTFVPVNGKKTVRLATDINIEFLSVNFCADSAVWKFAGVEEATGQRFITVGGVTGNPGPATVDNWFKIEKEGDHYALVFCPTVCKFCKVVCGNLGLYSENVKQFLALNDPAFPVKFKKA